jgi:hypothetical protein
MSAPPLPDAFGNYALGEFIEIVPPAAISWLPQTIGWAWLGLALLLALLWYGYRAARRWYHNRYRREAIHTLQALATQEGDLAALNSLLKQTALAAFQRQEVAKLSGQAWLDYLNSRCPQPCFDAATGQLLSVGSYRDEPVGAGQWQQLISSSRTWILQHRGAADA